MVASPSVNVTPSSETERKPAFAAVTTKSSPAGCDRCDGFRAVLDFDSGVRDRCAIGIGHRAVDGTGRDGKDNVIDRQGARGSFVRAHGFQAETDAALSVCNGDVRDDHLGPCAGRFQIYFDRFQTIVFIDIHLGIAAVFLIFLRRNRVDIGGQGICAVGQDHQLLQRGLIGDIGAVRPDGCKITVVPANVDIAIPDAGGFGDGIVIAAIFQIWHPIGQRAVGILFHGSIQRIIFDNCKILFFLCICSSRECIYSAGVLHGGFCGESSPSEETAGRYHDRQGQG